MFQQLTSKGYSTSELGPMLHNLKKEGLIVNAIQSDRKKQGLLVLNNQAALASCEGYGLLHPLAFLQHCVSNSEPLSIRDNKTNIDSVQATITKYPFDSRKSRVRLLRQKKTQGRRLGCRERN